MIKLFCIFWWVSYMEVALFIVFFCVWIMQLQRLCHLFFILMLHALKIGIIYNWQRYQPCSIFEETLNSVFFFFFFFSKLGIPFYGPKTGLKAEAARSHLCLFFNLFCDRSCFQGHTHTCSVVTVMT